MENVLKDENNYLERVLFRLDEMILEAEKKRLYNLKEVEDMGIPDLEQKSYFRKCKEAAFKNEEKMNSIKFLKENTHFGRMDLEITEGLNHETITMYLGEKSINEGINNLVYDWRSPVGNLYYMNNQDSYKYNDCVYELNLKRQIDIKNSVIQNVYNSYLRGNDVNITDDFLIKVLNDKKGRNEFVDIIKTIQSNQNDIIRDDINTNQIVQGVAGSGKTVVLLHRLSYLLYNFPNLKNNKLIFITPSIIFKSKLSQINRSLSLNDLKMITMEEYYFEKIKYYIPSIKIEKIIKDDFDYETLKFIYSDDFDLFLDGIIKNYKENIVDKKFIERKDNVKKIMDIVFKKLKEQYKFENKLWNTNKVIIKAFAFTILEIYTKYGFSTYNDYEYMYIDEMQDYAYSEYRLIDKIEKRAHLNLYGDIEQAIIPFIEKKEIDMLGKVLKNTKQYKLDENYRNTKEIANYVNNFLEHKMKPMGINSDEVKEFNICKKNIFDFILANFDTSHVILTNDNLLQEKLKDEKYENYSIKNAKGLEFSKVVVILENFSSVEKYVAFTRTLDKLFVVKIKED